MAAQQAPIELRNAQNKLLGNYVPGEKLEIISKRKKLYGGNTIKLDPNATTTVTGNLPMVNAVAERGLLAPGLTTQGANPGGINILRSPKWDAIQEEFKPINGPEDEPRYWKEVSDAFWERENKPWLDEAVARGDKLRFVSDPNDPKAIYAWDPNGQPRMHNGVQQKSIFGREVDYLKSKGYSFEPDGTAVKAS